MKSNGITFLPLVSVCYLTDTYLVLNVFLGRLNLFGIQEVFALVITFILVSFYTRMYKMQSPHYIFCMQISRGEERYRTS